jgi:hypothetical protein
MREFSTSLLLNTLRATLDSLERNQSIDQHYRGICELKTELKNKIERIECREPDHNSCLQEHQAAKVEECRASF